LFRRCHQLGSFGNLRVLIRGRLGVDLRVLAVDVGASGGPFFDERLCRNAEALMQPPDHLERKWPSAIEHFVHAISAADEGITWLKPILVHVILNRFHWVGEIKRIILPLPGLNQGDEYIKLMYENHTDTR
jgi:hypothetical protein